MDGTIAQNNGPIWRDGSLVEWSDASLHVLSHGLNYASCVFEGVRVYGGVPFKLTEHLDRFARSADTLGFTLPYSVTRLHEATLEVIAAQKLQNGYVRPVAWKGDEDISPSGAKASVHVAIAAMPMGDVFLPEVRRKGVRLQISKWVKPSSEMSPVAAKASCHYVLGGLAMQAAKSAGFDDALLLDTRGQVAESTGSNVFIVKDGVLYTPVPDCALNGITRQTVMELAEARGIDSREVRLRPEDVRAADEAFLTGTAYEILPIAGVDETFFAGPHPITEMLIADYEKLVGKRG